MLINPIGFNQQKKQSNQNFGHIFNVSGEPTAIEEAYKLWLPIQKQYIEPAFIVQSKIFDGKTISTLKVACSNELGTGIFSRLNSIADNLGLFLTGNNRNLYKKDPKFDLNKI